jgi:hypothetical protein
MSNLSRRPFVKSPVLARLDNQDLAALAAYFESPGEPAHRPMDGFDCDAIQMPNARLARSAVRD